MLGNVLTINSAGFVALIDCTTISIKSHCNCYVGWWYYLPDHWGIVDYEDQVCPIISMR